MTCQSVATDITAALKTTTVEPSDVLALVRSSTLYGVTFTSLQTALGATGQIKPVGSGTAVQILNKPSTGINFIRSILPTQGITAVVDAFGNINVKTNLANAGSGADGKQLIVDSASAQIKFKRLAAGSGISLTETTNGITVSATELALTSKTVIVTTMADFPAAVGGARTLQADTDYIITTDLTTTDRFATISGSPCVIRSADRNIVSLAYTGAATMFTAPNPKLTIKDIDLNCANGTLLDTTGSTSGIVRMSDVGLTAVKTLGVIDSISISFTNVLSASVTTDGFTFLGASLAVSIDAMLFSSVSAGVELFNLGTASFNVLGINNVAVNGSAATSVFLNGAAGSANMATGTVANVTQVIINGDMTALTGVTASDNQFNFSNCNTIAKTRPDVFGLLLTPTPTTLAANTPALISGTWTEVRTSHFDFTSSGRATYVGVNGGTFPIIATVLAQPVSSTNKAINFYFAKNGTVIANSKTAAVISNTIPEHQTMLWQDAFITGDYYELYVESVDGTNVQIDNAKFAVN